VGGRTRDPRRNGAPGRDKDELPRWCQTRPHLGGSVGMGASGSRLQEVGEAMRRDPRILPACVPSCRVSCEARGGSTGIFSWRVAAEPKATRWLCPARLFPCHAFPPLFIVTAGSGAVVAPQLSCPGRTPPDDEDDGAR
jgi:hypothetical protein